MARISNKIDNITGKTEADVVMKEQFNLLLHTAQAQCETFKAELKEMFRTARPQKFNIIGKHALEYHYGCHVNIDNNCDDAIKNVIDKYFDGGDIIKNEFQVIVKHFLENIINDTKTGETQGETFFIYPENYQLVRVDIKYYKNNFSSHSVIANCDNLFCYTMSKSVVDDSLIKIDDVIAMASQMVGEDRNADVSNFVVELEKAWVITKTKRLQNVC